MITQLISEEMALLEGRGEKPVFIRIGVCVLHDLIGENVFRKWNLPYRMAAYYRSTVYGLPLVVEPVEYWLLEVVGVEA